MAPGRRARRPAGWVSGRQVDQDGRRTLPSTGRRAVAERHRAVGGTREAETEVVVAVAWVVAAPGSFLLRFATRAFCAVLFQEPSRLTRFVPLEADAQAVSSARRWGQVSKGSRCASELTSDACVLGPGGRFMTDMLGIGEPPRDTPPDW